MLKVIGKGRERLGTHLLKGEGGCDAAVVLVGVVLQGHAVVASSDYILRCVDRDS